MVFLIQLSLKPAGQLFSNNFKFSESLKRAPHVWACPADVNGELGTDFSGPQISHAVLEVRKTEAEIWINKFKQTCEIIRPGWAPASKDQRNNPCSCYTSRSMNTSFVCIWVLQRQQLNCENSKINSKRHQWMPQHWNKWWHLCYTVPSKVKMSFFVGSCLDILNFESQMRDRSAHWNQKHWGGHKLGIPKWEVLKIPFWNGHHCTLGEEQKEKLLLQKVTLTPL